VISLTELSVTKMNGCGNTYGIIEDLDGKLEDQLVGYSRLAKAVSDKVYGVWSDGILVVQNGEKTKYRMRVFNPDGSEAEMCGNGIRMFARYLYDKKMTKEKEFPVETYDGSIVVVPRLNLRKGKFESVTVDMGKGQISERNKPIDVLGANFLGHCISVGNPHYVTFHEEASEQMAKKYGPSIENHPDFQPERTNVEFAKIVFPNWIDLFVWERGAGFTQACGTGASVDLYREYSQGGRVPVYVYNLNRIGDNLDNFRNTISKHADRRTSIHYAMKANFNEAILEYFRRRGACIDAVSPREVESAVGIGFPPEKVLYTPVMPSDKDMERVLKRGVGITIDSVDHLEKLRQLRPKFGYSHPGISFRCDPGIHGAGQGWGTMTAGREVEHDGKVTKIKFSVPYNDILEMYKRAKDYGFEPVGIHFHVGSNWKTDEEVNDYLAVLDRILLISQYITRDLGYHLRFLDVGGGPGIRYKEGEPEFPLDKYAKETFERIKKFGIDFEEIKFEPGRSLVGDAGLMEAEVNTIKNRYTDIIVGVNAGFDDLARVAMYGAHHEIINCNKVDAPTHLHLPMTVGGNLCETGDVFTQVERLMAMPENKDILAFHNAGAYGFSMSSYYNLSEPPIEVVIENKKVKEVIETQVKRKRKAFPLS